MRKFSVHVALAALGSTALFVQASGPAGASTTDCKSAAYACTPGYDGANAAGTWAWKYYGGSFAQTASGIHNCTLYSAWRLQQAGMPDPGRPWGNAAQWAGSLGGGDHNPTVGSVAWWGGEVGGGAGHVAIVEQVSGGNVFVRADNHTGFTSAGWVAASAVDLFLHPHDAAVAVASPPPPPLLQGSVSFDKTENTGSGRVEGFSGTFWSGYQSGMSVATTFGAGLGDDGTWGILPDNSVSLVKTKNNWTGQIEAYIATAASGYQIGLASPTRFGVAEAENGTWGMLPDGDVSFVKTKNTGSGRVEAYTAIGWLGYQTGISATSRFGEADSTNGTWGLAPNGDLWFVKLANTGSGQVEAFSATAASGYTTGISSPTRFSLADAGNGSFGMLANGDVYFVKTRNTGSGRVEAYTATLASGYQSGLGGPTRFGVGDAGNGRFAMF